MGKGYVAVELGHIESVIDPETDLPLTALKTWVAIARWGADVSVACAEPMRMVGISSERLRHCETLLRYSGMADPSGALFTDGTHHPLPNRRVAEPYVALGDTLFSRGAGGAARSTPFSRLSDEAFLMLLVLHQLVRMPLWAGVAPDCVWRKRNGSAAIGHALLDFWCRAGTDNPPELVVDWLVRNGYFAWVDVPLARNGVRAPFATLVASWDVFGGNLVDRETRAVLTPLVGYHASVTRDLRLLRMLHVRDPILPAESHQTLGVTMNYWVREAARKTDRLCGASPDASEWSQDDVRPPK